MVGKVQLHKLTVSEDGTEKREIGMLTPDRFFEQSPFQRIVLCELLSHEMSVGLSANYLHAQVQMLIATDAMLSGLTRSLGRLVEANKRQKAGYERSLRFLRYLFAGLGVMFFYMFTR